MRHVFTRVSGYGVALLPECGTSLSETAIPTSIRIRVPGEQESTISIESARRELAGQTSIFNAGIELTAGTGTPSWQLETSVFTCDWPRGLELVIPEEAPNPPFYLLGPGQMSIWINGPLSRDKTPTAEKFRASGHAIRKASRTGEIDWIEVAYPHDGESWMQRYYVVPWKSREVLVVVMQALDQAATADPVALLVASIRETPRPPS